MASSDQGRCATDLPEILESSGDPDEVQKPAASERDERVKE